MFVLRHACPTPAALLGRLLLVVALVISVLGLRAPAAEASSTAEQAALSLVNQARSSAGLTALQGHTGLADVARRWARSMSASGSLQHNPDLVDQAPAEWQRLGENVGFTRRSGASANELVSRLHGAKMDSAAHRANIQGDFTHVGIGVTVNADGTMWMTQVFAKLPPPPQTATTVDRRRLVVTGDWNGNGVSTPAYFIDGTWHLKAHNTSGATNRTFTFGQRGDIPVVGDWNGNGRDGIGVVRGNRWLLRDAPSAGTAQRDFAFGRAGDTPVVGNWDGRGGDGIGVLRGSEWLLRRFPSAGSLHHRYRYAIDTHPRVVGDWNGDGRDTAGVVRGDQWRLRDVHSAGQPTRVITVRP